MLLAQMLQRAELTFVDAQARHTKDGLQDVRITCATDEEQAALVAWLSKEKLSGTVRRASPDEVAQWKKGQES